jgi:tRNA (adenine57-N1/adenine58-N1)-methyltransferase catalytic subunit
MDRSGKHYLVRMREHGAFHFHLGVVKHDDILGHNEGVIAYSSLGKEVWAYRPRMHDFLMDMPRKSAIIYPKDIAFILLWADIFPGARVLESGVGSGALAIALLRALGPTGTLITYDLREDMIEHAKKNAQTFFGDTPNWTLRVKNVYEGIDDGPFDRIVLDVPDPGLVAPHVADGLTPGGILCSYVPNITQVLATAEAYQASRLFSEIETFETLYRRWDFRGATARPVRTMISHTGFLTVARRGQPREPASQESDSGDL